MEPDGVTPTHNIIAMCSGRGGGKSWGASAAIGAFIYQNPKKHHSGQSYFENRCTKGVGWCLTIDNKQGDAAEEAFVGALGMIEDGGVIVKHLSSTHSYLLWWPSKLNPKRTFKMEFHSAEREKSLRGRQVDFLWCDESAIFTETVKMRGNQVIRSSPAYLAALKVVAQTGGPVIHTTTPKGKNWFYDWIYQKSLNPDNKIKFFGGITTYDNRHLSARAIEMFKSQSTQHDWDQEIMGLFKMDPEGMVYPFDDTKHCFNSDEKTPPGEIIAGIDFGFDPDPFCYIWVKKCKKKGGGYRYYVMEEMYEFKKGIDQLVPLIKLNPLEKQCFGRYADPSRPDSRDYMSRKGMPTWMAKNDWEYGHAIVASYLERGDLLISRKCKYGIEELSTYEWGKNHRPKAHQMDHFCDALRYVLASEESLNVTVSGSYAIGRDDGTVFIVEPDGTRHVEFAENVPTYNPDTKKQMEVMKKQLEAMRAIEAARAVWKPTSKSEVEPEEPPQQDTEWDPRA